MPLRSLNFTKISPIIAAFLCTASGIYIFGEAPPEVMEGNGIKAASVFRSAMLVILWKLRVYPRSLKRFSKIMQCVIEFLLAMYFIEYFQAEFWLPLEAAIKNFLLKLSQFVDDNFRSFGVDIGEYVEYLSNEWTACFVVYGVSLFFFISVLHATKLIDLRDMKYGPEPFIYAIMHTYNTFQELLYGHKARAIMNKRGRQGDDHRYSIKGGHAAGGGSNNQKSIGWRKEIKNTHKEIEWPMDTDYDLPCADENYSDFEMDFN